ncbi:type I phosphomannose isomerase catalytic subunit [Streptomyces sp. NBC_00829]|uniref:type I phosphomannose isomerase catalytic subunit n=1 Tax=Streptomyces sp. NBC_00829 TaxID=2903679 RepID=UPI00386C7D7F
MRTAAYPSDPSAFGNGTDRTPLNLVESDTALPLGPDRPRLPFLLKVLAVKHPLSLQVNPETEQAVAGDAREEAAGLAPHEPRSPHRCRHAPTFAVPGRRAHPGVPGRHGRRRLDAAQSFGVPAGAGSPPGRTHHPRPPTRHLRIEITVDSDNVQRGGPTPKYVDVAGLSRPPTSISPVLSRAARSPSRTAARATPPPRPGST